MLTGNRQCISEDRSPTHAGGFRVNRVTLLPSLLISSLPAAVGLLLLARRFGALSCAMTSHLRVSTVGNRVPGINSGVGQSIKPLQAGRNADEANGGRFQRLREYALTRRGDLPSGT